MTELSCATYPSSSLRRGHGGTHYEPPAAWACVGLLLGAGAHLPDSLCLRVLAAVGLAYLLAILWQNRRYSGEPPVVWSWIPFLGSAIAFGKAPLAWLRQSAANLQSDVFVAVIAGERTAFATDPVLQFVKGWPPWPTSCAPAATPRLAAHTQTSIPPYKAHTEPSKHQAGWPLLLRESPERLQFKDSGLSVVVNAFGVPAADAAEAMAHGNGVHGILVRCLQQKEPLCAFISTVTGALEKSLASLPARAPLFGSLAPPLFRATMAGLGGVGSELATDACHDDFIAFDGVFPLLAAGAPLFAFPGAAAALRRLAARFSTDTLYCTEDDTVSELLRATRRLFLAIGRRWDPTSHGRMQASPH